jgi:formate-dependent phosphoribosylglycinamide formyltransferase (GAR transformylase)
MAEKVTEALGGAGLLESNFLTDDGVYFGIIASTS